MSRRRAAAKVVEPFTIATISDVEARERFPHVMARVQLRTHWICCESIVGWQTDDIGGVWIQQSSLDGWRAMLTHDGCTNPEALVASVAEPALVIRHRGGVIVRLTRPS